MTSLPTNGTHAPLIPFGVSSFVVVERTVRLVADDPQFAGFEVDVRSNLAGFERERLIAGLDEIDEARRVVSERAQDEAQRIDADRAAAIEAGDTVAAVNCTTRTTEMLIRVRREAEALSVRQWPLVAPYIHAWNACEPDEDGGVRDIPPPRVGGSEAFERITPPMVEWVVEKVVTAYRSGKGLSPIALPTSDVSLPLGSVPIIGGPKVIEPSTQASRRKSIGRSA